MLKKHIFKYIQNIVNNNINININNIYKKKIKNNKLDDDFVIIEKKESEEKINNIINKDNEIYESEIVSFSSNEEMFRNLCDKYDKENMCNRCNNKLFSNNKYKGFKILNDNDKYKYYCLQCGLYKKNRTFEKKEVIKMDLIYKEM